MFARSSVREREPPPLYRAVSAQGIVDHLTAHRDCDVERVAALSQGVGDLEDQLSLLGIARLHRPVVQTGALQHNVNAVIAVLLARVGNIQGGVLVGIIDHGQEGV